MPIVLLPPELIAEIFGHCSEEALAKCALISKSYLDLARSHLYRTVIAFCHHSLEYYTMSCPSMSQIFSHTKHVSFENFTKSYVPFLQELYRLGRLETIAQQCYFRAGDCDWDFMEECLEALLKILSLPSLRKFWFCISGRMTLLQKSKFIPSLLTSPKLRDLSLTTYGHPLSLPGVCLENLDTLRSSSSDRDTISIDYSTIRRRVFTIDFHPYQDPETFMGSWVASTPQSFNDPLGFGLARMWRP